MTRDDLIGRAVPLGYRIAWKFCWLPTLAAGRTVWLRSIPVLERCVPNRALGVNWGDQWVAVALLDNADLASPPQAAMHKPAGVGDFF